VHELNGEDVTTDHGDVATAAVRRLFALEEIKALKLPSERHHRNWSMDPAIPEVNTVDRVEVVLTGEDVDQYVVEDGEWRIQSSAFHQVRGVRRPLVPDAEVGGDVRGWD
jgi:hypothetical protein